MRLFFLFSSLFLCFITTAQETQFQSLLIDESLKNNANAVIRLDEMIVELRSKKEMVIKKRKVVTVLNRNGVKDARTVVSYDNFKKVKNLEIIVYDIAGREIDKIKKKDFNDVSAADGFSLYVDYRLYYYSYTPISYPYTLEFNYELVSSDTGAIPSWNFLNGFTASVEKSRYSVSYDTPDLKPVILEKNLEDIAIDKKETNSSISYTATNILAIKSEILSPSFGKIAPKLMVRLKRFHFKGYDANVDNWKDLGLWVNNELLAGRDQLDEATKAKAKSLVAGISDDLEKAKIIYKYVQDNTRYISVQIGIGGLQPISAIEVDRVKYGDCKGLSNYTMALLKSVGVTSYYVVVQAGNDKIDFEEDFADLVQGNHVILTVPYNDEYYWIDCTSQTLPFGYVGTFTDDRKVMVIKPEGGEIITTTAYVNESNYQKIDASYELKSDGSISGNATVKTKGVQYYQHFRLNDEAKDDVIKYYKNQWSNINNLHVADYSLKDDKNEVVFTENISLDATNYASISGNRILFAVNTFNNNDFVPNRYRNRKLPFEIQRGFLDEDEFTIQLPEGYQIEAIPNEKLVDTDFGSYKVSFEENTDTNSILYKRSLFVKKGIYPKEKYAAYRDFRKETANMDDAQIVLVKK